MSEAAADLGAARYVSLATFRRNGAEVRTPVWVVGLDATLYCFSAGDAGKVKRVRANGRARVASCDARGGSLGAWHEATARLVDDATLGARVYAALRRKYGWQMALLDWLARLTGRLGRRQVIAIEVSRAG
ncbi:MAG: PPOX class F420-dependent oxidoreductase [Gammaproteobacteria bacterium]